MGLLLLQPDRAHTLGLERALCWLCASCYAALVIKSQPDDLAGIDDFIIAQMTPQYIQAIDEAVELMVTA